MSSTDNSKNSGSRAGLIAVAVAVFVGLALVAAFVLGGDDDDAGTDAGESGSVEQVADVVVSGEPLIPLPAGANPGDPASDPAVGIVAPTLTGTDFGGNEVEIGPDGEPKVVLFLAHWCPHCQRELPAAVELMNGSAMPEGLAVYSVSTAHDSSRGGSEPSVWFDEENWEGPVIRDSATAEAFSAFGGAGFPFAVYLDGENRVLFRTAGELGVDTMTSLWLATAQS